MINPQTGFGFDGVPAYQPVSPTGRYVVYNLAPIDTPTTTLLRRIDGPGSSDAITVERADASALYATGYRPPTEVVAKAADGTSDLYGVLYRPAGYDPQRRYPVILGQYNSPTTTNTPRYFGAAATSIMDFGPVTALAELGFIVVIVDPRGTPYRGAAFSDPPPGFLADMGLKDQVAAMNQLAAKDPSMDMGRVGVMGASFGGWTVLRAMLGYPDVFKVGTAWAAPGAFYNLYDAAPLTSTLGAELYAGGSRIRTKPNEHPENWASADSIAQVDRLKGKLLLGVGGLDENVIPGSTLQFYDAAVKANKQVELMFMPNSTHGPAHYIPYVTRHTWDFMVRNLAGETPPDVFPVVK
jgi:dipeptidyl aminopeptidase/acylaminoacyl peptidase